ncbi:hypothetical protein ACFXI8_26755 [Streptomyces niveus]|uniref:hypothetical protein n=1 Tax=Streptomyces niveus TaxID=193462 RepID=UPI00368C443A
MTRRASQQNNAMVTIRNPAATAPESHGKPGIRLRGRAPQQVISSGPTSSAYAELGRPVGEWAKDTAPDVS